MDLFTRRVYQDFLTENIRFCLENKGLELYCYSIMPSHVHLISLRNGGKLSDLLRDFKSFTAKGLIRLIKENPRESRKDWLLAHFRLQGEKNSQKQRFQIWKHDNHPFLLESSWMIEEKYDYIHNNPVESGFVNTAHEWRLSSANPLGPLGS